MGSPCFLAVVAVGAGVLAVVVLFSDDFEFPLVVERGGIEYARRSENRCRKTRAATARKSSARAETNEGQVAGCRLYTGLLPYTSPRTNTIPYLTRKHTAQVVPTVSGNSRVHSVQKPHAPETAKKKTSRQPEAAVSITLLRI